MSQGLTSANATELIKQHGYNELPSAKPKTIWRIAREVIREPMFILLISCGFLYLLLGDYHEGIMLSSSIIIIIFITFYQHRKTEKSLDALRQLSSPRALVIRDGTEIRIAGREVVPGDIILLNEGDRVPADALVLKSYNLTVDESLLTGESIPVIKTTGNPQRMVFSGTLVVQGSGVAKVFATGLHTEFGKIGRSLKAIDKQGTNLQLEMKALIRKLFFAGAMISMIVIIAFYISRGGLLESLLNGLAAAMAILPEEFPVVLTIFLALGAWRLSKIQVLTRNPSAIETLGSATVLCSDKTGTITQNKMEVAALHQNGITFRKEDFLSHRNDIKDIIANLYCASGNNSIDPMEKAIIREYKNLDLPEDPQHLIKEYSLSKDLFAMTRVIRKNHNSMMAYCKGAPEAVFELCNLSVRKTQEHLNTVHRLAEKGLRVIAAAKCKWEESEIPDHQSAFKFSLTGLVGFEDPIRTEVPDAIQECNKAGIKVIMITGDYPATAKSVARKIGLPHHEDVLDGSDLRRMSSLELQEKIKSTRVFARIIPEQKLQIIEALKANDEVVAMTGDGVNDAPALKAADIGVAMGMKGTDVAREASSLVLLDDNFASIVSAIRSGRKVFDNLQKAMSYILAVHIPIIGLVLIPAFLPQFPILLMPLHIAFIELIIDPACSIAFESQQEEKGIMSRPPREPKERFFGWSKVMFSLFKGLLLLAVVLSVFFLSIREGHTDDEARTIVFTAFIFGNVFLILNSLSTTRSFIAAFKQKNLAVIFIVFTAFIFLNLIISVPVLQNIFSFQFPGYDHFIPSMIAAFTMLLILELIKRLTVFISKRNRIV